MFVDHILCWITTLLITGSSFADGLEARFTCREQATLYLDGEYSLTFNWTHWMVLPDDVLEVAIKCHSDQIKGGLIASLSNGIVSDSKWKCQHVTEDGWFLEEFDDSMWPTAHEFTDDEVTKYDLANSITGVNYSSHAKWIWREDSHITVPTNHVYCRRRIGNIKAQVRCDDEGAVFLDGKFAGSTSYFTEIWKSSLARNTMVMAVKCKNNYGPGGLLASFSNGIVSNRHWKCGNSEISCTDIDFDDSVWKDAREIMSIQYDLEKKSAFPPEAKWIWVDGDNHHVEFQEICCRVLLHPQELHDENESHTNDKCDTNVVITIALGCLLAVVVTGCITLAVLQFTKNRKGKTSKLPRRRWRTPPKASDPNYSDGSLTDLLIGDGDSESC